MESAESMGRRDNVVSEVDHLLPILRKEVAQRRNANRWLRLTMVGLFLLMIAQGVGEYVKGKPIDFADLLLVGSLLGGSCAYGLTPNLRRAVIQAVTLPDKRLLGAMIESTDSGEPELKEMLEGALTGLLAQVTVRDVGLLDDRQLEKLVNAVRSSRNAPFCRAAIRALGSVGTHRTLLDLEILANDPSISPRRQSLLEPHLRGAMAAMRMRLAKERLMSCALESNLGSAQVERVSQASSRSHGLALREANQATNHQQV